MLAGEIEQGIDQGRLPRAHQQPPGEELEKKASRTRVGLVEIDPVADDLHDLRAAQEAVLEIHGENQKLVKHLKALAVAVDDGIQQLHHRLAFVFGALVEQAVQALQAHQQHRVLPTSFRNDALEKTPDQAYI